MRITLAAARVNKGMTQEQLAEAVGVSKGTVGSWERGATKPNSDKIPVICKALEVHYDNIKWNV